MHACMHPGSMISSIIYIYIAATNACYTSPANAIASAHVGYCPLQFALYCPLGMVKGN